MANITKTYIEKNIEAVPTGKQVLHFDDQLKGFGVRVTAGSKTFILDRKLNGKTIRQSIGRYPDWSVQQARDRARELIVELDKGIDIRQKAKPDSQDVPTLQAVFDRFLSERQLKPRTKTDYRRYLNYYMADWLNMAVTKIDAAMVMVRYKKIATSSSGTAQATSAMRALRSIFNFAVPTYGKEVIAENPVLSLTAKRAWIRDKAKTDHLREHEVKAFVLALRALENPVMAAYLEFILLTGARRSEAALLKWKHIDDKANTLTFVDPKNHTDRTIPMTPHTKALLASMRAHRGGSYVFWTLDKNGKETYIKEPRKAMANANKVAGSAVTVHGLRRTFSTFLEAMDCPSYPLKSLLGHSLKGDVTSAHYTQINVERLRPWAEKYETFILKIVSGNNVEKIGTDSKAAA